jgi:D-inositol-3-phosphate glycosyltransferase
MISVHSCPLATLGGRETGGMNVYVRELSRHLSDLGIAVDVYTRRQDPCHPTVVDFAARARVIHLPAGPAAPYSKHRVWDHLPEFVDGVQDFINENALQYDLIHSHYWLSGWVAMQIRPTLDLPIVHMSHTLGYPKNAAAQLSWEQEPSRRLQVERQVLRGCDALVAESPASKRHMIRYYDVDAANVAVIPCGVDMGRFRPQNKRRARADLSLPPTAPVLLFVGRLQPSKGIDTLLRAVADIRRDHPDVCVLVVGGGLDERNEQETAELNRLQALGARLELSNVRYVKAQPQENLAQYYAAADVFVMPSHYESFGMVVLEAMACGTPVVASAVGGLSSTVIHGDSGLLVPSGDWRAFAQAISRLLTFPHLQSAMRQAGPERARAFAWSRIVNKNVRLYRRLILQQSTMTPALATEAPCPATPA